MILSCNSPTPVYLDQNHPELVNAYKKIDDMIIGNMTQYGLKSFVASIVYMDKIVWSKGYGKFDPLDENSRNITIDDNVRIASVTKVFTGIMMFKLKEQGLITLDDEVTKWIPEFQVNNPYPGSRGITLRQLSSHLSGLPRDFPCQQVNMGTGLCSEENILKKISSKYLIHPPYYKPHYSNLGFALLGRTLQRVVNTSYEQYVEDNILKPLGMENSTFDQDLVEKENRLAPGLVRTNMAGQLEHGDVFPLGWGKPSGGLFSTARDMAKFMIYWLNDNNMILDPSTKNEAMEAIGLGDDGQSAIGTPFEMYYSQKNQIWYKTKKGDQTGYTCKMAMAPDLKLGAFFSSMLSFPIKDVLTHEALDILVPVYTKLLSQSSLNTKQVAIKDKNPTTCFNVSLTGTYLLNNNTMANVTLENGVLYILFSGVKYIAEPFKEELPLIKRIKLINPVCQLFNGDELVYFSTSPNSKYQATTLEIASFTLQLASTNPNIKVLKNKIKLNI